MYPFKRLLLPFDGSDMCRWVIRRAGGLLAQPRVAVTLLAVIDAPAKRAADPGFRADPRHDHLRRGVAFAERALALRGIAATALISFGDPATEILREAGASAYDLLLMATHVRSGIERAILGSVAHEVLRASATPLVLFRPLQTPEAVVSPAARKGATQFRRILVPLDGSEAAEEILDAAGDLARTFGSTLVLFRAMEPEGRDQAVKYLAGVRRMMKARGLEALEELRIGPPAEAVLAAIRANEIDAVAMTTHGRSGLQRIALGSVTEAVLRGAEVPVLTIRNRALRPATERSRSSSDGVQTHAAQNSGPPRRLPRG
jgi:nucleotide-binding universal stress UspA family protein